MNYKKSSVDFNRLLWRVTMRKIFLLLITLFLFCNNIFAEEVVEIKNYTEFKVEPIYLAHLSVEGELGWNGYVGFGTRIDYRLLKHISVNTGFGLGYWGVKIAGGLRYYWDYPFGLAFGLGATYNSAWIFGYDDASQNEPYVTYSDKSGNVHEGYVKIERNQVTVINFTLLYSKMLGLGPKGYGAIKLFVETGYAYPTTKPKYEIKANKDSDPNNDIVIKDSSFNKYMKMTKPGGFILTIGVGFIF
jgi:hypothetical protein